MNFSRRAFLASAAALPAGACATDFRPPWSRGPDLGDLDATATADLIRRKEISALEALDAAIARAEAVNPRLNFLVTKDYDRARAAARGPLSGPFAGVPMLLKDLDDQAGLPTRNGSRWTAALPPAAADEARTNAVKRTGVVLFGKSATPEYGFLPTTEPLAFGPTRNPWALDRSAGGSSGGAAAAVAAGVVPMAHATDGGGSIRIPASCCGLFGLKTSRGRTLGDLDGPTDLSVQQVVSRTVRDAAGFYAATERTGADARLPPAGLVEGPSGRKLSIGFTHLDALGRPADRAVEEGVSATAALLASLGHQVEEATWPSFPPSFADDFTVLWAAGAARLAAGVQRTLGRPAGPQDLEPFTLELARLFGGRSEGEARAAAERLGAAARSYLGWFGRYDVVLTPVLASPPPLIGWLGADVSFAEMTERLNRYVGFTPIQNVAGSPAMSVPLWWSREGLPVGMQFSAAVGAERTLLELAYQLEDAKPWAGRRPPVRAG